MNRAVHVRPVLAACTALLMIVTPIATGQDDEANEESDGGQLIVATQGAPPFVVRDGDSWTGLSIELWEALAEELDLDYRLEEASSRDILEGVADGRFDAGIAALAVTPERERRLDFSHPYYTTGFGIATDPARTGWLQTLGSFFSLAFLQAVAALALLLAVVGVAFWLAERRGNPDEFHDDPVRGIGDGFWFSAVTMTTVGYGDKAPRTRLGRLIALVWMFAAIIILSTFTGMIASSLTANRINATIRGPGDLPDVEVGTVGESTADDWLVDNGIGFSRYESSREGMQAVLDRRLDAFVYDKPLLRYLDTEEFGDAVDVGKSSFGRQDYAIALPDDSPLREALNRALLQYLNTPAWEETKLRHLGEPG